MTQRFKDICELRPDQVETSAAIAEAASVPWLQPGLNLDPSGASVIDFITDNLQNAGFLASPRVEIDRGEIDAAIRRMHVFPQNMVFGPLSSWSRYENQTERIRGHGRGRPIEDPNAYAPQIPMKTVAARIDPFRFVLGKIYYNLNPNGRPIDIVSADDFDALDNAGFRNDQGQASNIFRFVNPKHDVDLIIGQPGPQPEQDGEFIPRGTAPVTSKETLGISFISEETSFSLVVEDSVSKGEATFRIESIGFYNFPAAREMSTLEADNYLISLFPSEDEFFQDTRFIAPVSFFKSELPFVNEIPKIYSSVASYLPKTATPRQPVYQITPENSLQTPEFYEEVSATRAALPNIYSDYLDKHPIDFDIRSADSDGEQIIPRDSNPAGTEPQSNCDVVVEKYPHHAVEMLQVTNAAINAVEGGDPQSGQITWLDNNSQAYVEVRFKTPKTKSPETSIVRLMTTFNTPEANGRMRNSPPNLSTQLLEFLDAKFSKTSDTLPLFTSLHTLSLEGSITDETENQEDFYSTPNSYSINNKVFYNYRPRVIENPLESMISFYSLTTADDVERPQDEIPSMVQLFKKSEYPFLFDNHELMDSREGRVSYLAQTAEELAEFRTNVYRSLEQASAANCTPFQEQKYDSEVIAFRVEKVNVATGKVLKEFYFFNAPSVEEVNFIDNQVNLSERYLYNIYAINFVFGHKYRYKNLRRAPDEPRSRKHVEGELVPVPSVVFELESSPCLKIIETPYFSQEVTVVDLPPMPPEVTLERIEDRFDGIPRFRFRFEASTGHGHDRPVPILEGDDQIINKMRSDQVLMLDDIPEGHLKYSGTDSVPDEFQLIALREAPLSYSDFSEGVLHSASYLDPVYNFNVNLNERLFFTFRTKDLGGISNPSHIYKFEFSKTADGDYYSFEVYEPELEVLEQRMTCERFLSVKPAIEQSIYNYGIEGNPTQQEILEVLETAPNPNEISLGSAELLPEELIWNKKFKIRLKSVNTGKALDLNFKFEKVGLDDSAELSRSEFQSACSDKVAEKNATITEGLRESRKLLEERSTQSRGSAYYGSPEGSDAASAIEGAERARRNNVPGSGNYDPNAGT